MSDYEGLTLDDELLLGDDDLQIERRRGPFQVTDLELATIRSGYGVQLVVTFENDDILPFPIKDRFFVRYDNPEKTDDENQRIVQMGQGQLSKIRKWNEIEDLSPQALVGAVVSAEVFEDDNGFLRIGRYRKEQGLG